MAMHSPAAATDDLLRPYQVARRLGLPERTVTRGAMPGDLYVDGHIWVAVRATHAGTQHVRVRSRYGTYGPYDSVRGSRAAGARRGRWWRDECARADRAC